MDSMDTLPNGFTLASNASNSSAAEK